MESLTFAVSLPSKIRNEAKKISLKQNNPQKARQVELNHLAVYAVNFYISQCLEIETDLDGSDSQNFVMQSLIDVADLNIVDLGKLECRPILKGENKCHIPAEVWEDRIGYLVVEIDEEEREANLLGFTQSVQSEKIAINDLGSLDDFLRYLEQLLTGDILVEVATDIVEKAWIELNKWFDHIFENGWQPEEKALNLSIQPSRSIKPANGEIEQPEVNGAKVIRLGMQMQPETVVLILRQKQLHPGEIDVNLRLYPSAGAMYLPDDVKLEVLDETGNLIPGLQAQARASNWLQMKFTAEPRDKFSVKVSLGESSITEHFLL